MPELPEVETMRRGILPTVGSRILRVEFPRCRLKPITIAPRRDAFRRRVAGRTIVAAGRRGKRVLAQLDDETCLAFEPRMTGLVLIADPPNTEHLRLRLWLSSADCPHLMYWDRRGLGSVRLLNADEMESALGPGKLGIDALLISVDEMRDCLKNSRREIKVALLDQRAVAGIGNLYASEMLHAAAIHPQTRCDRLTKGQWQQLHKAMVNVLNEAIRHEGSTLSDGTYRNALNQSGGYQNQHRVYDRAGQNCMTCRGAVVVRIVQAQRGTFFCPVCQAKTRRPVKPK